MLCGNCGHDERVHRECDESCVEGDCRCSQFEVWDIEIEELVADCDEEESYVEFNIKIPRVHVADFVKWLTTHSPDDLPAEPMKIPDTIQLTDLNLDDPETRKWLAEKILSKN